MRQLQYQGINNGIFRPSLRRLRNDGSFRTSNQCSHRRLFFDKREPDTSMTERMKTLYREGSRRFKDATENLTATKPSTSQSKTAIDKSNRSVEDSSNLPAKRLNESISQLEKPSSFEWKSGTSFTDRAWTSAKSVSGRALQTAKESTQNGANWAGTKIASTFHETKASVSAKIQDRVSKGVDSAKTTVVETSRRASTAVKSTVSDTVGRSTEKMTQPMRNGWQKVTDMFSMQSLWSSLWWWSLAAIGVYGVATTVPKELIRQTFGNNNNNTDSDGKSQDHD